MREIVKKKAPPPLEGTRLEYVALSAIEGAKRNPKKHELGQIASSMGRFGYVEPVVIDERTWRLVAGHGRVESLGQLKKSKAPVPKGIRVNEKGEWMVPAVRGWSSKNDAEADAYLLASNQLTIAGGWDEEGLLKMLTEFEPSNLDGLGWSPKELERLMEGPEGEVPYTDRIESPIYKPTGEKPALSALCDTTKYRAMCEEIDADQGLSEHERAFLKFAAHRHVVFDYQSIAEFYAHAREPMQKAMEKSALVIIDYKQAIALGFVKLTESLAEVSEDDRA